MRNSDNNDSFIFWNRINTNLTDARWDWKYYNNEKSLSILLFSFIWTHKRI